MRVAWFTPLPPSRSGIASYSSEILPLLAANHAIDVFVDRPCAAIRPRGSEVGAAPAAAGLPPARSAASRACVRSAHDFVHLNALDPYDLVVYQLGNATCHDYMWAYLPRYPGLLVLHDGQVHLARARQLLAMGRAADYSAEFRYCHPDAPPGLADLIEAGLGGTVYYFWPLVRIAIECSRLVAVHSRWLVTDLSSRYAGSVFGHISMGTSDPGDAAREQFDGGGTAALRERFGIPADAVVFAAFGRVTPEKRIGPILRALGEARAYVPSVRLLLVGEQAPYYDVKAEAVRLNVWDAVTTTGFLSDREMSACMSAADVCLCLRWPSGRETSASWLRCLAAGKPTIVTELAHTANVPALDPRTWTTLFASDGTAEGSPGSVTSPPIAVAVDILDEDHSLGLAMRRLAADARLRTALGREARLHWERAHTLGHMARDYEKAMLEATGRQPPRPERLPSHLAADGTATASEIVRRMGVGLDWSR